jgi:hypothetical protein
MGSASALHLFLGNRVHVYERLPLKAISPALTYRMVAATYATLLQPIRTLRAYASAGVDPKLMDWNTLKVNVNGGRMGVALAVERP